MTVSYYPVFINHEELPFYLTGIGISDPEYHVVRDKGLVSHQFLFTESGSGIIKVDNKEIKLKAGSVFYLAPQKAHEYYPDGEQFVTKWLVFRGAYANKLMKNLGFADFIFCENGRNIKTESLFNRLLSAARSPLYATEESSILLYEFILKMRRIMLLEGNTTPVYKSIALKAIEYIDNNYMRDITDETLAGLSGISVQHFCRVFKAETSMRPFEYIAKKRIAKAKTLLTGSTLSIGEIAAKVGYADRNYFTIVFRRLEGVAPKSYRLFKGSSIDR